MEKKIPKRKYRTHEQFIQELHEINSNIEVLSRYTGLSHRIKCKCSIDQYEWECKAGHLLEGHGCPKCGKSLQLTHNDFLERMYKLNPNIIFKNRYENSKTMMECQCTIDGYEWKYKASNLLFGKCKCPQCRNKLHWDFKSFINRVEEINPTIQYISGNYKNALSRFVFKCLKCGCEWESRANHLLNGHGCPCCTQSTGERDIEIFLNKNLIQYEIHKTFSDLRGLKEGYLSYDFYLPNYNLLIEYNGKQHYTPVELFGGEAQFQIQQEHDCRKRDYAYANNYNLLEIPYTAKDNDNTYINLILNKINEIQILNKKGA